MTVEKAASRSPVPEGTLIAGKYRVGQVLGVGGMGVVVAARHEALEQDVAVKFLLKEATTAPEAVERFVREARAAAKLASDHVVRVFDTGVTEDGLPYLVMERLEGFDLHELTERGGAVPVEEAVGYVLEALEAVGEAHRAGIVHRDLKPSNLFLSKRPGGGGRLKVLDFGISKLIDPLGRVNANLTSTQAVMGSPGYMSPEQVRSSRNVDARTDVWSMGVILWELLTGEPAFPGESLGDVFAKIREEDLPRVRSIRPEIPEELDAIVRRCVTRDREGRFPDGQALADALRPFTTAAPNARASLPFGPPLAERVKRNIVQADTMPAPEDSVPDRAPRVASSTQSTFATPAVKMKRRATALSMALAGGAVVAVAMWAFFFRPTSDGSASNATAPASAPPPPRLEATATTGRAPEPLVVPGGAVVPPEQSASASASSTAAPKALPPVHAKPGVPTATPPPTSRVKPKPDDLGI